MDLQRIRKVDEYIYFYDLIDYYVQSKSGYLSAETYGIGDCKLFRYKFLTTVHHKEPMGRGTGVVSNRKTQNGNILLLTLQLNVSSKQSAHNKPCGNSLCSAMNDAEIAYLLNTLSIKPPRTKAKPRSKKALRCRRLVFWLKSQPISF